MRRFDYDNSDEYRDDIDQFFGDEDDDEEYELGVIEMLQANFVAFDLNRKLLKTAIKMAERSFLWRFWPIRWKLKAISDTYYTLNSLVEIEKEDR
jgi:hypothetical protein